MACGYEYPILVVERGLFNIFMIYPHIDKQKGFPRYIADVIYSILLFTNTCHEFEKFLNSLSNYFHRHAFKLFTELFMSYLRLFIILIPINFCIFFSSSLGTYFHHFFFLFHSLFLLCMLLGTPPKT